MELLPDLKRLLLGAVLALSAGLALARTPLVLMTDFGRADGAVSAMRGVATGKPVAYLNSLVNLSIAINQGNFAKVHKVQSGADWRLVVRRARFVTFDAGAARLPRAARLLHWACALSDSNWPGAGSGEQLVGPALVDDPEGDTISSLTDFNLGQCPDCGCKLKSIAVARTPPMWVNNLGAAQ